MIGVPNLRTWPGSTSTVYGMHHWARGQFFVSFLIVLSFAAKPIQSGALGVPDSSLLRKIRLLVNLNIIFLLVKLALTEIFFAISCFTNKRCQVYPSMHHNRFGIKFILSTWSLGLDVRLSIEAQTCKATATETARLCSFEFLQPF